jgi:hypothetical protein
MSIRPVRVGFAVCTRLALLAIGCLIACETARTAEAADPKEDLIRSLKGADVQGYLFSLKEEESQTTFALTNKAVEHITTLGKGDTGLVLKYSRIEDKKTNTTKTYKSEITKQDDSLGLVVTELATNTVIVKGSFPSAGPGCSPTGQFDSLNDCINEFNCANNGRLQCDANRTCDPQFAALTCCLKNGTSISVHLIIRPNSKQCVLQDLTPEPAGLVLSQD